MAFNLDASARDLLLWLHDNGGVHDAVMPYEFLIREGFSEQTLSLLADDLTDRGLAEQQGMGGVRLKLTTAGIRAAQLPESGLQTAGADAGGSVQYNTHFHGPAYGASVGGTNFAQTINVHHGFDAENLLRLMQQFREALDAAQGLTADDLDDLQDRTELIEAEAKKDEPNSAKIRRHLQAMAGKVGTAATKGALTVGADQLIELIGQMQTGVAPGN